MDARPIPTTRPTASLIIVNWNGLAYLRACLPALITQLHDADELIVVDNGSADGSVAWVNASFPQVRLIPLRTNLGFAQGNNLGMRLARSEVLVALNNDTIPAPDFLEQLLAVFAVAPQVGMAASVLTFAHRPEVVASAGIAIQRNGLALDLWQGQPVTALPAGPVEIFGPSGGAAAYRRQLLEDVGLFEPSFWMYLEDADLAWRARLRGWRCLLAPAARVRHVYSASSGQGSPLKQRLLARNRLRLLVRCLPDALLLRWLPAILVYDLAAAAYGLCCGQPAIFAGRATALHELPGLLVQRRAIQRSRIVSVDELAGWARPTQSPQNYLAQQQQLNQLIARQDPNP